jgi:hypothetical protein
VSEAVQGQVSWEGLDIRLLPFPRAVLRAARVDIPGTLTGSVELVQLDLSLLPLLRGRAEIRAVTVQRPELQFQIAASPAPVTPPREGAPPTDMISAYRQALGPVMSVVQRLAPDTTLALEQGRVRIQAPGLPPIGASEVDLRIETDSTGMAVAATAEGEYWDRLQLKGRIEFADLRANAALNAVGVKPQTALDALLADVQPAVVLSNIGAQIEVRTDGRSSLDVALTADLPKASLRRGDRQLDVVEVRLKGTAKVSGEDIELELTDIRLGELVPAGRVSLRLAGPRREPQAGIEIEALDLERLRIAALALAGDQALVREYAERVRGGNITDLRLSAKAETLSGLAQLSRLSGSLTLADGIVLLPIIEQPASEVGAQVELIDSTLKLSRATARLGASRLSDGSLDYALDGRRTISRTAFDLDLAQAMTLARGLLPEDQRAALERIQSVAGRAQGSVTAQIQGGNWDAEVAVAKSDSVLRVKDLPWPVSLREGRLAASPGRIALSGLTGGVGASGFAEVGADVSLGTPLRVKGASGQASLALGELYPWLRSQKQLAKFLETIPEVSGGTDVTLNGLEGRLDQPDALAYEVTVRPRNVRARMTDLPGPATVDGGSLRITPNALAADGVVVGLLDSTARLSGQLAEYRSERRRIDASIADGVAGKELVEWIWQRASLPQRALPVTPVRFAAQRMQWSSAGLDVAASAQFEAGPAVGIDLGLRRGELQVRRLTLKDRESDAVMSFATRGRLIDAGFAGVLTGRSLASMLTHAEGEHPGRLQGDMRVTLDRDMQGRTTAQGRLAGQNVNLGVLLPVPVKLERIDLEGEGSLLHVRDLTVDWAEQKATIRGEISRQAAGPVIRAEVDSPGIVLDALLPAREATEGETGSAPRQAPEMLELWPLPLSGTLEVRADYLQFQRFRVQPVRAKLALEPERAELKVDEAALCGIDFPFTVTAVPGHFDTVMRLSAKGQELESVAQCFTDQRVLITGRFDLDAEFTAKGRARDVAEVLEGPVEFHAQAGQIRKFALLGNILSLASVSSVLQKGVTLGGQGFGYRDLIVRGRFGGGKFTVEQAALDSDALGLAATGSVSVVDYKGDLTVLVAPFGRLDRLVRKLPIIGYIVGGTFTSIPVGVSGDMRDPLVVPLGPGAVSSQLVGIFERTLKLPGKLLEPLGTGQPEKGAAESQ